MNGINFITECIGLICQYIREYHKDNKDFNFDGENVYVVWSCKTLKNNKALLATDLDDNEYYEVTYNGETKEFYLDVYQKVANCVCRPEKGENANV